MPARWYKEAVIYSLGVDSFQDSDGDGCGDLPGVTSRLDYLARLGVTCVWLNPIHPSPHRDYGYDITDCYGIDPRFGSLGDFRGTGQPSTRARYPPAARPRGQSPVGRAPMVSIRPQRPGFALPRGDAVLLCEANVSADDVPKYCAAATGGPNDRCAGWTQGRWSSPWPRWPKLPAMAQWATFPRDHDELDLSKLTDEQRSDVMAAFAPKADMRIYDRGIRRRLAPMMKGDRRHMQLAYSPQFTMPGAPLLRSHRG